jgi:glutamyl-tRNA reductase
VNLLVVGASHRTAPVSVLERLTVAPAETPAMLAQLLVQTYVGEAVVLSTCNRVEVYTAVSAFHGGLADVCATLAQRAGCPPAALAEHLYVHYDAAAIEHTYRVASGLDSMVVGESQILGQLREAYHTATEADSVGRLLHELMQQGLRVGKRVHTETDIDRAGQSVVSAALDLATRTFRDSTATFSPQGPESTVDAELAGRPALVIGAGAMGALAAATLSRAGAAPLAVANRGADRATRLAAAYGATPVDFDNLTAAVSAVDLVVSATASTGPVLTVEAVSEALAARPAGAAPLVILDLAVPRDVMPAVGELPGVVLIDIERLGSTIEAPHGGVLPGVRDAVEVAEGILSTEVEAFLGWLRGTDVAPTVAALRARADDVVTAELRRLAQRRPDFTDDQRSEIAHAVHRVVQRLLHSPTVRARQLAAEPGGDQYTALLRELFDLDVLRPRLADDVTDIADVLPEADVLPAADVLPSAEATRNRLPADVLPAAEATRNRLPADVLLSAEIRPADRAPGSGGGSR